MNHRQPHAPSGLLAGDLLVAAAVGFIYPHYAAAVLAVAGVDTTTVGLPAAAFLLGGDPVTVGLAVGVVTFVALYAGTTAVWRRDLGLLSRTVRAAVAVVTSVVVTAVLYVPLHPLFRAVAG